MGFNPKGTQLILGESGGVTSDCVVWVGRLGRSYRDSGRSVFVDVSGVVKSLRIKRQYFIKFPVCFLAVPVRVRLSLEG